MNLHFLDKSDLKRPFIIGGAVVGCLISVRYLYRNFTPQLVPNRVPDPIWTCFVNVALVMFASIYLANLLRRIVEFFLRKGDSPDGR